MLTRIGIAFLLLSAVSNADERGAFVTLDRADHDKIVSVGLAGSFAGDDNGSDFSLRASFYGRYAGEDGGAYAQIAFSAAQHIHDWQGGVTNLELGGMAFSRVGDVDVIWRAGLALPTATSDPGGATANLLAFTDRILDYPLVVPETAWIRPGIALRFGNASFFGQVDGGLDLPISKAGGRYGAMTMGHLNGGIGGDYGSIALTGELANDIFSGIHMLHSVTVSIRWHESGLQPYLAAGVAFDDSDFATRASLTVGLHIRPQ